MSEHHDNNGNGRMAKSDKWQIFLGTAGLVITLSIPLLGVGVGMLVRQSVTETKLEAMQYKIDIVNERVEDVRIEVREMRGGRHSSIKEPTDPAGTAAGTNKT